MARLLGRAVEQMLKEDREEVEATLVADETAKKDNFACSECDFVAKNAIGLKSHMRRHNN